MRRALLVGTFLILVGSLAVVGGNNTNASEHASDRAHEVVVYQSALVDRLDLPEPRLPVLGGYMEISQSSACHYLLGWANPTGTGANEAGFGPGRSNYPDRGLGGVDVDLWVDGTEVSLKRTGGVWYGPGYDPYTGEETITWWNVKDFWVVFPANTFTLGTHIIEGVLDVSKGPYIPFTITLYVTA